MKSDIVVFGEDWGRHPSATQHLIRHLAPERRVLWINSIGMRRPRLDRHDLHRVAAKLRSSAKPNVQRKPVETDGVPVNMTVVSPRSISWPGSSVAFAVNRRVLGQQIRHALAARDMTAPILWTSLPTALPVVGQLGERAVVYYCGDDFGALAGVDHEPVMEMEASLVRRADVILAASPALAARFPVGKTLVMPHGADIALFTKPAARAADLPSAARIAGFYGSLSSWVDVELLADVAGRLTDWIFVFVGQIETDVSALRCLPNAVFLGRKPHADLPSYSQHWTVSMLPFRDCAQIRACNPLKLREYLAAGQPVVSTDFPALDGYRDVVTVARGGYDFAAALRKNAAWSDRTSSRRERVASETWEARAHDVDRALAALQ